MNRIVTIVILCAASAAAQAQTAKVIKCTVNGKVTYTNEPCIGGDAVALPALPPPLQEGQSSPALSRELEQQKATLHKLETERRAREAKDDHANQQASKAAAAHKQKCAKMKLEQKWADEDAAHAASASSPALKQKSRHAAEALALECPV